MLVQLICTLCLVPVPGRFRVTDTLSKMKETSELTYLLLCSITHFLFWSSRVFEDLLDFSYTKKPLDLEKTLLSETFWGSPCVSIWLNFDFNRQGSLEFAGINFENDPPENNHFGHLGGLQQ